MKKVLYVIPVRIILLFFDFSLEILIHFVSAIDVFIQLRKMKLKDDDLITNGAMCIKSRYLL